MHIPHYRPHRFVLVPLSELTAEGSCYLVGGAVRDALAGRMGKDLDFVTPGDPTRLARQMAETLGGHWFFLDEQRRQSRVAVRNGEEGGIICDFAPFRGDSLFEDLTLRDFTINAMALPLLKDGELGDLYDPLNGKSDLRKRLLRICSPKVLLNDPLRVLKGIRHCLSHGLAIESKTLQAMRVACSKLTRVAPERIRDELFGILSASSAERGLRLLHELKITALLFGASCRPNAFTRGVKLAKQAEGWLTSLDHHFQAHLTCKLAHAEIESGIRRDLVLKLGAFLTGYGAFDSGQVLENLRCSRRLQETVKSFQGLSGELFQEFLSLTCGARGRALWVANLGPDPVSCLLFLAILGRKDGIQKIGAVEQACVDLQAFRQGGRIPDLVDGRWLRKHLGFDEGPEMGRALATLRREEIAGRVNSRREAELFLETFRKKTIDKNGPDF